MVIQCASLSLLPLKVVFSPYIERIFLSPSLTHMAHYPAKHYLWTESLMLEVLHGVIRLFYSCVIICTFSRHCGCTFYY